jgi:tRNA pseudouridine38-40 synthase
LNSFIGPSIVIFNIFPVGDRDHARFSALSRTYQYHVLRNKDPFRIRYAHYIYGDLEINLMNHGAEILQSATDFSSFAKAGGDTKHNICTIYHCTWNEHDGELVLTITANRFLRNMVRSIVGTLLDLGRKRISINDLQTIIDRKERSCAGESVPAKGLFLTSINYPETIFKNLRNQT